MTDFLLGETCGLTAQLLPWLSGPRTWWRLGRLKLWGPLASLSNLRFGEFIFADAYFVAYATRQDAGALERAAGRTLPAPTPALPALGGRLWRL